MNKLKVITVVGTRPEIIRLSRVISKLDKFCDHILVHTGQNYDFELNEVFFKELEIRKPQYFLQAAGENAAETFSKVIFECDKVLQYEKPDALLCLGDTNSCISVLPAKRRKIPTFHMEAGNRCFDERVPEEINRRLVDHISDINLTYSSIAREYLLQEGLPPDRVIKTGSPMFEVLDFYKAKINQSEVLKKLKLQKRKFFLISLHREENIENLKQFNKLSQSINSIAEKYKLPIIFSTHPRTAIRIKNEDIKFNALIKFIKPLGFLDYNKLQINAKAVLSDSGTITEESSILGFPALNLRDSHERPEGMEEASVMMVGSEKERILQGLEVLNEERNKKGLFILPHDYSKPNLSNKIIRILHSYTDYVNKVVWKKY